MANLRVFFPLLITAALLIMAAGTYGIVSSQSGNGKYDADGDGLIEVSNLEQLNAIRYDLDGGGRPDTESSSDAYAAAFPTSAGASVCEINCSGYELIRSLDFDSAESYASGTVNTAWTTGSGWLPIGPTDNNGFNTIFNGNGYSISNLFINRTTSLTDPGAVGLFAYTGKLSRRYSSSIIHSVGIMNADITGREYVGSLVGYNRGVVRQSYSNSKVSSKENLGGRVGGLVGVNWGEVIAAYATGIASSDGHPNSTVGGLVGVNYGTISSSYATTDVSSPGNNGGLAGWSGDTISASYATGKVTGITLSSNIKYDNSGGLVGSNSDGAIVASYWDTQTSGLSIGVGDGAFSGGQGKTTAELKSPTSYSGIYSDWHVDLDNADQDFDSTTGTDDFWDFGTSSEYPAVKADFDGDGVATWQEFGNQRPQSPAPTARPTAASTPTSTTGAVDSNARPSAEVFGELVQAGLLVSVWRYHNATQSWDAYDPSIPAELNDLTHAAPEDIVWLEVTDRTQFQGRTLHKGWNLISLK